MSAVASIELTLTNAIRDVISAATRPVPAGVPIRAMFDAEPVERPFIVAIADAGESLHPKVRRITLSLRVRYQADATTAAIATGYLHACAAALMARAAALATALATAGLKIMVFTPADFTGENEDARGRFSELVWAVTLTTTPIPVPPTP
jgi:hypothetical protein